MNDKSIKRANVTGILMQIPMWLLATWAAVQFCLMLFYSLTEYDYIEPPTFIGFENFKMLADDVVKTSIKNTVVFYGLSSLFIFAFGVLPAIFIARLKRWVGLLFAIGYSLLTFSTYTNSLRYFFSSDSYGALNSWLLSSKIIVEPILWTTDKTTIPAVLLLSFAAIGPAFIIAYAFTVYKKAAAGGAAALSVSLLLMVGADTRLIKMFGFPSADYKATTLTSIIADYAENRFECGKASAMAVFGFLLLSFAVAFICGMAVLAHVIFKKREAAQRGRASARIIAVSTAVVALVMLLPLLINISNVFKSTEELFTFPVGIFAARPTLENFGAFFEYNFNMWTPPAVVMALTLIDVLKRFVFYMLVILPSAIGAALIKNSKTKALLALSFIILPFLYNGIFFLLSSETRRPFNSLMPLVVFLAGYYVTKQYISGKRGALALGIPASVMTAFAAAVTFVNFSNIPIRREILYNSLYMQNSEWGGILSRASIAAVGDLLLLLLTVFFFLAPAIMFLVLRLRKDKI